ncbi:helix-turn-helix transcriptional regulator [Mammaliicoccus vitulinus]|uniref:helix-turn-helix domain-containing protein n=1 Tax=Mammaliicoccus vitulinus TaxID=71237 RepID=UPI000E68106E|nr:helix-turn-helix transcriptional regulator [Mammaliicoccus vitulinus]MBM6628597.1 helix-turn-helix transcriptional regulator [Mammaliicoccus vitulinus]RIL48810.1 XRE family transcriptional regulator [Mammaliicoccus fleurettii]
MTHVIKRQIERTGMTQQRIAQLALTTKSNVSMIMHGQRSISSDTYKALATNSNDGVFVTDILNEFSEGFSTPTHSDRVYYDHPGLIKDQLIVEMYEAIESLKNCNFTKRPEFMSRDEKENVLETMSECKDVLFQGQMFLNKTCEHIQQNPRDVAKAHEQKLKMERRI